MEDLRFHLVALRPHMWGSSRSRDAGVHESVDRWRFRGECGGDATGGDAVDQREFNRVGGREAPVEGFAECFEVRGGFDAHEDDLTAAKAMLEGIPGGDLLTLG
jgi:hypothetical protein